MILGLEDGKQRVDKGWPDWRVSRARHLELGASANGSGLYPKNNEKLMKGSYCLCG